MKERNITVIAYKGNSDNIFITVIAYKGNSDNILILLLPLYAITINFEHFSRYSLYVPMTGRK